MRVVKRRSPWLQVATVVGGFFVGPFCASRLSAALAPDSLLVEIAGFFGFALVFMVATFLWMGLGMATVLFRGLRELAKGGERQRIAPEASEVLVPPGYRSYWVLGTVVGCSVGFLAGLMTPLGVSTAVVVWGLAGLLYGLALWAAAHHGYLPFPEPE